MLKRPPTAHLTKVRRAAVLACMVTSAALITGCAAFKPQTAEQTVERRATERWDYMRADKFDKAYQYNAPSYRELRTEAQWRSNFGPAAAWTSSQVKKVTCETDSRCTAEVEIGFTVLAPMMAGAKLKTAVSETWLREAGNWYIAQPL